MTGSADTRAVSLGLEPPRGMRDVLPDEAELRDRTTDTILRVYRRHGFRRVETPALESIGLLTRGQGGENEKLIFKVLKRGEKLDLTGSIGEADLVDLGLRFDLTVPLSRYYARHHARLPKPFRAVQIGPVWRAERPQRGRYRQFTQCDIDILGVHSEAAEIELIVATTEALAALGLGDLRVRLNDRRLLTAMAGWCGFRRDRHEGVFIALDKLDKVGAAGVRQDLERAGHPEVAIERMLALLAEFGDGPGVERRLEVLQARLGDARAEAAFASLGCIGRTVEAAAAGRFRLVFDPTLVRGMTYYTGPIFEIAAAASGNSIAGGGRYDALIGTLLGRDVPATGFSIGFERVIALLLERPAAMRRGERRVALRYDEATADLGRALEVARALRDQGHLVSLEPRVKNVGRQRAMLAEQGFDGVADFDEPALGGSLVSLTTPVAPAPPLPAIHWFRPEASVPRPEAER